MCKVELSQAVAEFCREMCDVSSALRERTDSAVLAGLTLPMLRLLYSKAQDF